MAMSAVTMTAMIVSTVAMTAVIMAAMIVSITVEFRIVLLLFRLHGSAL